MLLDISRALKDQGTEFPFLLVGQIPEQDVLGEQVSFDKASMSGFFSAAGKSVLIHGELETVAHARCARCLKPAQASLTAPFREIFIQDGDPEDPDKFAFEGNCLDLDHLALSLAVLELPIRFICRADCKGLCPVCGGNLNDNLCACQKESPKKHPFEALQQLLKKDEEV